MIYLNMVFEVVAEVKAVEELHGIWCSSQNNMSRFVKLVVATPWVVASSPIRGQMKWSLKSG